MIIRGLYPSSQFTRVDKRVFVDRNLSDGAKVLYGYMLGLRNGQNFSDKYIMKALDISKVVLARRKKELKDRDLILVEQIAPRVYFLYIGYSTCPASKVRETWISEEEGMNDD